MAERYFPIEHPKIPRIQWDDVYIRNSRDFINKVPICSGLYECLLEDSPAAENKCTDWMKQQKKKILHKLCIDVERFEYTSFSMLAILKCEFQWTNILMSRYMDSRG